MADDPERRTARAARRGRREPAATAAAQRLYQDLFTAEERAALEGAVASDDLAQELALLRVLIRRGVADGQDLETLSRSLARLGQLLRVQHVLRGQAARNLDQALARVLEEIGTELGV
jgi:hypothetical protein